MNFHRSLEAIGDRAGPDTPDDALCRPVRCTSPPTSRRSSLPNALIGPPQTKVRDPERNRARRRGRPSQTVRVTARDGLNVELISRLYIVKLPRDDRGHDRPFPAPSTSTSAPNDSLMRLGITLNAILSLAVGSCFVVAASAVGDALGRAPAISRAPPTRSPGQDSSRDRLNATAVANFATHDRLGFNVVRRRELANAAAGQDVSGERLERRHEARRLDVVGVSSSPGYGLRTRSGWLA